MTARRRLLFNRCIFGLFALAACFLTGCGWSGTSESETNQSESNQSPLRILLVGDPFAMAFEKHKSAIEEIVGAPVEFTILRYGDTLESIHRNRFDYESYFHIVSFDIMWLGELVEDDALLKLGDAELTQIGFSPEEYYPLTLEGNRYGGRLYGIPIQPHTELFWYRRDLLDQAGFSAPSTFAELLHQARHFHDPANKRYGISWNALRGDALGQTIAHLYAAHGQFLLTETGQLQVETDTGRKVAELLLALKPLSPPDILTMAWDQRIDRFSKGDVAFTYGWAARNGLAETDRASLVRGKIGYAPPPVYESAETPYFAHGQWSLGIPKNLPKPEIERSIRALGALTSLDTLQVMLENGIGGLNRMEIPAYLDLSQDPTAVVSRRLAETNKLSLKVRPSHPQWPEIIRLCGVVFHDMLRGRLAIDEALHKAQIEGERLLGKE
jgi:multiple sugar transport system substrate-binding protein